MYRLLLSHLTVMMLPCLLTAQEVLVQMDNGNPAGMYSNLPSFSEESALLLPAGPCRVLEIRIYYGGSSASLDTVWVVGDASEGMVPPTSWVWAYNAKLNPIVVQYNGQPGWRTIDLRGADLRSDGYDRIVVQHRVKPSGPWWVIDNVAPTAPYGSFLMDPTRTNNLGGPGVYLLTHRATSWSVFWCNMIFLRGTPPSFRPPPRCWTSRSPRA